MTEEIVVERKKPGPKPGSSRRSTPTMVEVSSEWMESRRGILLSAFLAMKPVEVKKRYSEYLDTAQALQELSDLRRIAEQAALEINNRLTPEEGHCYICEKAVPVGMKFTQFALIKDHKTGTSQQKILCSIPCVQEYNRRTKGRSALIDSGEVATA